MTSFSVAICMKQRKILCGQLNCLVKLADVSTRCSSRNISKFTEQLSCPQRIFVCFSPNLSSLLTTKLTNNNYYLQDHLHSPLGCICSSVHELAGDYEPESATNIADERQPDFSANILLLVYYI